jgi:hypothetical protein
VRVEHRLERGWFEFIFVMSGGLAGLNAQTVVEAGF